MKKYPKRKSAAEGEEHLLQTLSAFQPMNYMDYAELSGLSSSAAHARMDKLHERRLIYVDRFERNTSGRAIPFYSIGNHPDALRPTPLTCEEKCRRWRESEHGKVASRKAAVRWRKSKNGKQYQKEYTKLRTTRRQFETGRLHAIDPLLGILFGRVRAQIEL